MKWTELKNSCWYFEYCIYYQVKIPVFWSFLFLAKCSSQKRYTLKSTKSLIKILLHFSRLIAVKRAKQIKI